MAPQLKFHSALSRLDCRPSTLPFFPYDIQRELLQAVREADLVYDGGGNTPAMLDAVCSIANANDPAVSHGERRVQRRGDARPARL